MITVSRFQNNPILVPSGENDWEKHAVFNASVVKKDETYHMLYRAISETRQWQGEYMRVSSIGYAKSDDGLTFTKRRQFIVPEYDWERFGVEDPRISVVDDTYLIFYTAVSSSPPNPENIRIGVALTKDFEKITEKHLVTPFNAKAMTIFPEKIEGKYVGILSVDTDRPPAKMAIVKFDDIQNLWDKSFWQSWYGNLSRHTLPLQRRSQDQVEVGLTPIKHKDGWVLVYSYIQNYYTQNKTFGVEAALLDLENPLLINGRTNGPFMVPESYFEKHGTISNIIFPSGGVVERDNLRIYYGASDTTVCSADVSINEIVEQMGSGEEQIPILSKHSGIHLTRYDANPILSPIKEHEFEEKAAFNAGVYQKDRNIYILYRASDRRDQSTIGLAVSNDGYHIQKRLDEPIYIPREPFEKNENQPSGCEDPRLTQIGDTIYMLYVAYDGKVPKVALTSIYEKDFIKNDFKWDKPVVISDPNVMDKNAAIFPEKINGKYAILHRLDERIWIDFALNLSDFSEGKWLLGEPIVEPRKVSWDSQKVGTASPPIGTELGWLLLYHGLSSSDKNYRLGIIILDYEDPTKVILRLDNPILEPRMGYEKSGQRPGTVFSCGNAILSDKLFIYYGAGDTYLGVAQIGYSHLLNELKKLI